MSKENLNISEMKKMQLKLYEINKEKWNDMEPKAAKNHILYMVEELGECISIIKKKGINEIMENPQIRDRFTEEFADVLMYYTEVLNRLNITEEEISKAYTKKHEYNMNRNFKEEYKNKNI